MRTRFIINLVALLGGVALCFIALLAIATPPQVGELRTRPPTPEFRDDAAWLNTAPLRKEQLRGKVVLVDFWTYDCINCLRHLPYVQAWHEKYRDKGLVVVGVHTPEYAHERLTNNVRKAIERLKIRHPIVQDNDYAIWKAYGNQYWPADYLIDKQGRTAYMHYGEGGYAEMEKRIEALLAEPSPREP